MADKIPKKNKTKAKKASKSQRIHARRLKQLARKTNDTATPK